MNYQIRQKLNETNRKIQIKTKNTTKILNQSNSFLIIPFFNSTPISVGDWMLLTYHWRTLSLCRSTLILTFITIPTMIHS